MARKCSFYSLSRCNDGIRYLKREGFTVPNDFNLDLAIYKTVDTNSDYAGKDGVVWHVVDTDCGLSIGSGPTRKYAIEEAFDRLENTGMDIYKLKAKLAVDTYGTPPNKQIFYL